MGLFNAMLIASIRVVSQVVLRPENLCHRFKPSEAPVQMLLDMPDRSLDVEHCGQEDVQREAKLAMAVQFLK
jgi:hypothetical protein